jgi:hypothetical protein
MKKRQRMNQKKSEWVFARTASVTHKKNLPAASGPMRGGIRL